MLRKKSAARRDCDPAIEASVAPLRPRRSLRLEGPGLASEGSRRETGSPALAGRRDHHRFSDTAWRLSAFSSPHVAFLVGVTPTTMTTPCIWKLSCTRQKNGKRPGESYWY